MRIVDVVPRLLRWGLVELHKACGRVVRAGGFRIPVIRDGVAGLRARLRSGSSPARPRLRRREGEGWRHRPLGHREHLTATLIGVSAPCSCKDALCKHSLLPPARVDAKGFACGL